MAIPPAPCGGDILQYDNPVIDEPEKTNARPPRIMVLIERPCNRDQQAENHRERNSQQNSNGGAWAAQENQDHHPAVPARYRFSGHIANRELTKTDWSKTTAVFKDSGMSTKCLIAAFMPSTIVMVLLLPPCLKTGT